MEFHGVTEEESMVYNREITVSKVKNNRHSCINLKALCRRISEQITTQPIKMITCAQQINASCFTPHSMVNLEWFTKITGLSFIISGKQGDCHVENSTQDMDCACITQKFFLHEP